MPNFRDQSHNGSAGPPGGPGGALPRPSTRGRGRQGSSFAARFGRVILQHGIAAIPSALYHYQGQLGLSAQQVWFVSYVLSHKWDEDLPYPSLKKMARCVPLSLSQLQRIKNSLCEIGYLQVYPRFSDTKGQSTNAYDFSGLFDRLEEAIIADAPAPNAIRADGEPPDLSELAEVDSSFVARYGRVITRHGVAAVPRAIFTHQAALGLTPQQVWLVTYIFSFRWDTALPYPSIRKMARHTGYSTVQLHNIKAELVEAGYLRLVRRKDHQGGQDTNAYDFSGLLDAIRARLQPEAHKPTSHNGPTPAQTTPATTFLPRRRGRRARPVEDSAQLPGEDSTPLAEGDSTRLSRGDRMQLPGRGSAQLPAGDSVQLAEADSVRLSGRGRKRLPSPVKRTSTGGISSTLQGRVSPTLHEEETVQPEAFNKSDSTHLSLKWRDESAIQNQDSSSPTPPPYSPYIAAVITDFSTELNDPAHIISNVTQALRLWQSSGLDEQGFIEMLYEAKRTTRLYQGKQGLGGLNNKMAYFFTVLRGLL